jgi:hypothetical protein
MALLAVTSAMITAIAERPNTPLCHGVSATLERRSRIQEVTRAVLGKLAEETDPWLVSLRNRVTVTHEAFPAAQNRCLDAVRGRSDALSYVVAEKRLWVHSVAAARLRAKEACMGDEAYVHVIFSPAEVPQRQTAAEPAAGGESAGTPAKVEAPVRVVAPSPAPVLAGGASAGERGQLGGRRAPGGDEPPRLHH